MVELTALSWDKMSQQSQTLWQKIRPIFRGTKEVGITQERWKAKVISVSEFNLVIDSFGYEIKHYVGTEGQKILVNDSI